MIWFCSAPSSQQSFVAFPESGDKYLVYWYFAFEKKQQQAELKEFSTLLHHYWYLLFYGFIPCTFQFQLRAPPVLCTGSQTFVLTIQRFYCRNWNCCPKYVLFLIIIYPTSTYWPMGKVEEIAPFWIDKVSTSFFQQKRGSWWDWKE